jgi:hypothetical protein
MRIAAAVVPLTLLAASDTAWRIDIANHRLVSRPAGVWRDEKVRVFVACSGGAPQFSIQVRDHVAAKPGVTLQFGGHSGRAIVFVGKDGVVRKYNGFSRGQNPLLAIASPRDSREIVNELTRGYSRLAWIVDTEEDGLDSLEVPTAGFAAAWQSLKCESGNP